MMDLDVLGRRIQGLRHDRGMTLQALALAAGVSVSMLSAVERGQKAPTIVVLSRIADGLGLPVARLLDDWDGERLIVRRHAEQDVIEEAGGWRRTILTPVVAGVNFEWIRTTLPPGADPGRYPAYASGSHEFVAVDEGVLRLTVGETTVDLAAGDTAYFAADVVHGYANPTAEPCTYHVAALIMRPRGPSTSQAARSAGRLDGRQR